MPWLIGITLFHGKKDMDQPFGLTCFGDELLDAVIFTESTEFTDEFNFNTIFLRNALSKLMYIFMKKYTSTYFYVNINCKEKYAFDEFDKSGLTEL